MSKLTMLFISWSECSDTDSIDAARVVEIGVRLEAVGLRGRPARRRWPRGPDPLPPEVPEQLGE